MNTPGNKRSELLEQLKIDRSEQPSQGMSPLAIGGIVGIVVVVGLIGGALLLGGNDGDGDATAAAPASTATPERAPAREPEPEGKVLAQADGPTAAPPPRADRSGRILDASGYITARRIATVSSEITGLITEVLVEEGMLVEAGQVLARLDNELASVDLGLAQARLASQRAVVSSVQANFNEAKRVFERAERLRPQGLVSEAELTEATARLDSLTADLERARTDVDVFKLDVERQRVRLADHEITAPFAGVVTVKNAQPGEIVSPGSAGGGFTRTGICTIVDMDSLEIEVDVNESFIGRVFPDQRVVANLDAYPDWDIPASVIAIIPTADRAKATVKVRIGIEARDPRILPDMGVKVSFLSD